MIDRLAKKQLDKIEKKYADNITNITDLTAGEKPTFLFYILANKLGYLLDNDPEKVLSKEGVEIRKKINPIIKKIAPMFLSNNQVIENRNILKNPNSIEEDKGIILPDEPVIWAPNHAFTDDTLATVIAAYRHAYIFFGSLPQFYNTFDGLSSWANGVVMTNRKVKESKKSSLLKAKKVLELGTDLIMFPEGVWNKTPDKMMLDLWPGIYKIAKETGTSIVPMAHYIRDCEHSAPDNLIHTVIDDPIRIDNLSEKAGLKYLQEVICSWYYLMMERYGKSTREEELKGFDNYNDAWEDRLRKRVATTDRYDTEIEFCADYRSKDIIRPEDVFEVIANVENITPENVEHVAYAKQLVKTRKEQNYQQRF